MISATLKIFSVKQVRMKLDSPILLNGQVLHTAIKLVVTWVDLDTGELLNEKQARRLGYPSFDYGNMLLRKDYILGTLRHEVRSFAEFVLHFRNKRRGLTPSIRELCHWYSEYSGKRADHVRRYIHGLVDAGILSGDNPDVLMPIFQWNDKNAKPTDYLSEMFVARNTFDKLMRRREVGESPRLENKKA